jgi:hypothetical protein
MWSSLMMYIRHLIEFGDVIFEEVKEVEMMLLNKLQKLLGDGIHLYVIQWKIFYVIWKKKLLSKV